VKFKVLIGIPLCPSLAGCVLSQSRIIKYVSSVVMLLTCIQVRVFAALTNPFVSLSTSYTNSIIVP